MSSCGEILFAVGILLQELILERVNLSRSFVQEDVGYLNVSRWMVVGFENIHTSFIFLSVSEW